PTTPSKPPTPSARSSTASSSPPARNAAATASPCKASLAQSLTGSSAPASPVTGPSPIPPHPDCQRRTKHGRDRGSKVQGKSLAPWNKWRGPARGEQAVYAAKGQRVFLGRARAAPLAGLPPEKWSSLK